MTFLDKSVKLLKAGFPAPPPRGGVPGEKPTSSPSASLLPVPVPEQLWQGQSDPDPTQYKPTLTYTSAYHRKHKRGMADMTDLTHTYSPHTCVLLGVMYCYWKHKQTLPFQGLVLPVLDGC